MGGDVGFSRRHAAGRLAARFGCSLALLAGAAGAQTRLAGDLADLSIEDLANIQVTSVSRRAERLADAPASLFVISGEDIRRSGVTSLPEALRLAPNLEVARIDSRQYAVSARGFNNAIGNKLLVLIDGRTVYTPLFSGVFWDAQDTLLEDVERIEVISGPGATLWGANAVSGVINVITRRASATQGTFAELGYGNRERGMAARQGFQLDGGGAMRVYGKFSERNHSVLANGSAVRDEFQDGQAGFRTDWGSPSSGLTLQGDAYRGSVQQPGGRDARLSGANVLTRFNREVGESGRLQLQAYLDNVTRDIPGSFGERLNTLDLDAQHAFRARESHFVTWGGGYRNADDQVSNSAGLAFLPARTTLRWANVFAQDEIDIGSRLRLTLGLKVETNPYTGREYLPSARLAWKPAPSHLLWGAASRAVRAPSRLDHDLFAPAQPPFLLAGGADFKSEVAKVLELGYRGQPAARFSYSVTGFYAAYEQLRSVERGAAGAFVLGNKMEGRGKGIETWGTLQASDTWRLSAGAVFLDQSLRLRADSTDAGGIAAAGNDPKRQFTLRSSHDLSASSQLDVMARHVSELPNPQVPAYTAVDLRYARRLTRQLEASATVQNLFDRRHAEFGVPATRSEIERALFLRLKWSP